MQPLTVISTEVAPSGELKEIKMPQKQQCFTAAFNFHSPDGATNSYYWATVTDFSIIIRGDVVKAFITLPRKGRTYNDATGRYRCYDESSHGV